MNAGHHGWDPRWTITLAEHIAAQPEGENHLNFIGPAGRARLAGMRPAARDALAQLTAPGAVLGSLVEPLRALGPTGDLAEFWYYVSDWSSKGLLRLAVNLGAQRLATLTPTSALFELPTDWPDGARLQLSRFALVHQPFAALVAESPLSASRITLNDPRAAQLLLAFQTACELPEAAMAVPALPAEAIEPLVHLFASAGLLTTVDQSGVTAESSDERLATWEFSDLLLHSRSRYGRYDAPIGGLFLHAGQSEPPPALKPVAPEARWIPLVRPELAAIAARSDSLSNLLERRMSIREYGQRPPTLDQLGEFFFRVARVKSQSTMKFDGPAGSVELDFAWRSYPGGGNMHELEFYALVQSCEGLEPGLYRYDPLEHRLQVVASPSADTHRLLVDAAGASDIPLEQLQILIVLAARFPRIAWKYAGIAYSLTLKHVGIAMQTMYLVATDMGLAPCSLGAGDADRFARAAGCDYYLESSVGEFLLGTVGPRSPSGT